MGSCPLFLLYRYPLEGLGADRSYDERHLLHRSFTRIETESLVISQRQLLDSKITIEDKAIAEGELIVVRKKLLQYHKAEICRQIVFAQ